MASRLLDMGLNIAFLCSGGGGNLRFVVEALRRGWIGDARVSAVFADRACAAHAFARERGIDARMADFSPAGQVELLREMLLLDTDMAVTTVHKVLVPEMVLGFAGRLVNLHYSLLPAFGGSIGTKPLAQALAYGARFVGTTCHFVEEAVDTGEPIVQAAVPVDPGDAQADLMDLLYRCGCICLLEGLTRVARRRRHAAAASAADAPLAQVMKIDGRPAMFSPPVVLRQEYADETFWAALK